MKVSIKTQLKDSQKVRNKTVWSDETQPELFCLSTIVS